jgi:acetyltransferase-like isoleucine patch superfamily enzyme
MNFFKLIYLKVKNRYSLKDLIFLEVESLLFGFFGIFPTFFGVILRYFIVRLLSLNCKGFCWIQSHVTIVHSNRIKFGHSVAINSFSYLNGIGGLDIGNYVLIGPNVTISSGIHPIRGRSIPIITRQTIPKKITIEDDVWIGAGAVIMPGITLARGTVVGANGVVLKSTKPFEVIAGIPAKNLYSR